VDWTDIIFAPIKPFVAHPERGAVVAIIFFSGIFGVGF
jgi:hypothetical protein